MTLRILLSWQYRNAVGALLGTEAANAVEPPPDSAINGLDAIGASQLALGPTAIELYESSALRAARAALSSTTSRGAMPPEFSPAALFTRLFGNFTPVDQTDPRNSLRTSVLDAVRDDTRRL